jgi:hypothetical protein
MNRTVLTLLLLPAIAATTPAQGGNGWDDPEMVQLPVPELPTILWTPPPPLIHIPHPCGPCFEDLPLGSTYFWNDSFVTGPFKMVVAPMEWPGGAFFFGGRVRVENGGRACGLDHELHTDNAVTKIFPSTGAMADPYFRFGEYGGNINVEVNGDFRNVNNMMDLNGLIIGGVQFNVLSGGFGNDCGEVQMNGVVKRMALGGQEFWYDCLEGTMLSAAGQQPDANGDGRADIKDVLDVLAAMGTSDSMCDLDASNRVDALDLRLAMESMNQEDPISIAPLPSPHPRPETPGRDHHIGAIPLPSPYPTPEDRAGRLGIEPNPSP